MTESLRILRRQWSASSLGTEPGLHQLSPYIGKLKSSIARALVENFSKRGDRIFEPFSGSGCVALEALRLGRSITACDTSPYAAVLTLAKLYAPSDLWSTLRLANRYVSLAERLAEDKKSNICAPQWVKRFFHKRTLAEAKTLADILVKDRQWFLLACLLGILHHQRPGFLSYPSSHLVPYLRSKKFPRTEFPELYEYRDIGPRLCAKIERAFRRMPSIDPGIDRKFYQADMRTISGKVAADVVVTSPPYMNALDYGRDNRLRLWFVGVERSRRIDQANARSESAFASLMSDAARLFSQSLKSDGKAVMVIGEITRKSAPIKTHQIAQRAFEDCGWKMIERIADLVPDVRRSRRAYCCTKREWVMVFRRI